MHTRGKGQWCVDQVSKLSITELCYHDCLPQTHNNKTISYSYHTILMLPSTWPCRLTHSGTAVPQVHRTPSLAQASSTFSPHQLVQQNSRYVWQSENQSKQRQEEADPVWRPLSKHYLALQPLPQVKMLRARSWTLVTVSNLLDSKASGQRYLFQSKPRSTRVFVQGSSSITSLSKHRYQKYF